MITSFISRAMEVYKRIKVEFSLLKVASQGLISDSQSTDGQFSTRTWRYNAVWFLYFQGYLGTSQPIYSSLQGNESWDSMWSQESNLGLTYAWSLQKLLYDLHPLGWFSSKQFVDHMYRWDYSTKSWKRVNISFISLEKRSLIFFSSNSSSLHIDAVFKGHSHECNDKMHIQKSPIEYCHRSSKTSKPARCRPTMAITRSNSREKVVKVLKAAWLCVFLHISFVTQIISSVSEWSSENQTHVADSYQLQSSTGWVPWTEENTC